MRRSSSVSNAKEARDTVLDLDFGPEDKPKEEIAYEPSEVTMTGGDEGDEQGNAEEQIKSQSQLEADGHFSKGIQSQSTIKAGGDGDIDHSAIYEHFKHNKDDLEFD